MKDLDFGSGSGSVLGSLVRNRNGNGSGRDSGLAADVVSGNGTNVTTTYARLEVEDQVLYMRELVVNGSSALEAIDRLSWLDGHVGSRYFS